MLHEKNTRHALEQLNTSIIALGGKELTSLALQQIIDSYNEPWRAYHTLQHIRECLVWLDRFAQQAVCYEEVHIALWLHDVIYKPGSKSSEQESADYASSLLQQSGIKASSCQRVHDYIMATASHQYLDQTDACLVMDIDMLILAADDARIQEYEKQIRQEYARIPGFIYRRKRRSVLQGFLAQHSIYHLADIRVHHEQKARDNISRLIAGL